MERLLGLGAGGHAAVLIETLRAVGDCELIGLITPDGRGERVLGVAVVGCDDDLVAIARHGINGGAVDGAILAVGMMGDSRVRRGLVARAREATLRIAGAIHPAAHVAESARVGSGVQVLAGAIVQARARLEDFSIVNTGAIVEHDCTIGPYAHVATGARLAGAVHVGEGAFVGIGAAIKQGVSIGSRAIIGAGAVVLEDVPEGATVVGVPARPIAQVCAGGVT